MSNLDLVQWLQLVGIIAGIIASCYVSYNQHLTMKWKREQNAREKREENRRRKEERDAAK